MRLKNAIEVNPGDVFNSWTVIKEAKPRKLNVYYLCRCECGTEREVFRGSLISGRSKSCGCKSRGERSRR